MKVDFITPEVLRQSRVLARKFSRPLVDVLAEQKHLPTRDTLHQLGEQFAMPILETVDMLRSSPALDLLPLLRAQQKSCALLYTDQGLIGVLSDPTDVDLMSWLDAQARSPVTYALALASDIQAYLNKLEESVKAVDSIVQEAGTHGPVTQAELLSLMTVSDAASPAVKLLNSTLYDALKVSASDVHLESTPSGLSVKYRIDGALDHAADVSGTVLAEQVISRLKVLAELDIAERRIPQDGSFRVLTNEREIDLRVSVMPSIHGEDAVIRVLDKRTMMSAQGSLSLDSLGFDESGLRTLRRWVEQPYGMLLVTGPTGSGKTTTLYAGIAEINRGRDKIITIEDPVEYQLSGVLQIPVNEKKGLTFARGLRSILRHDPDVIMVGEIRDQETAEIAVQSALTGHLVLTTVHANNVFDVFGRFTHMGIDPYAFVSALNGIWAQRLVRLNCPHCSETYVPAQTELERLGLDATAQQNYRFMRGRGCGDCRGTGYKGRKAVAEMLTLTDEIRELIIEKKPIRQIKEAARRNGTRSLFEASLDLLAKGETTVEEVLRVAVSN